MELENARQAIRNMAKKEGVSEAQAVAEMERAMEEARRTAYETEDTEKILFWEAIPCEGEKPTAYEFVAYISGLFRG